MQEKNPANPSPTTRFYGPNQTPYTPLNTWRLPRTGRMNDVLSVAPGIVGVVLQDGSVALVDEADYQLIRAQGWIGRWTQRKVAGDNSYPSINHGKIRTVGRLILDARKGEKVSYRDGDQNNLTRANLILKAKGGKEIGSSNRTCPVAPALGAAQVAREVAAVKAAVGNATLEDRIAIGLGAVQVAATSLLGPKRPAAPTALMRSMPLAAAPVQGARA